MTDIVFIKPTTVRIEYNDNEADLDNWLLEHDMGHVNVMKMCDGPSNYAGFYIFWNPEECMLFKLTWA